MPCGITSLVEPCEVGEGPHWNAKARQWSWVDNATDRLFLRYGDQVTLRQPGVGVVLARPRRAGGWVLAGHDGLYDYRNGHTTPRPAPGLDGTRFNDGACDARGRLWIGTMGLAGTPGRGQLYRVTDTVTRVDDGFDVCNGIGFSPDNRCLYLVDTVPRIVYRYAFDLEAGRIGDREIFFQFPPGMGKPDGLAVDAEGSVWCAMWDGACLVRLASDGTLAQTLAVPAPRPTSLAFGVGQMLVTTARKGLSEDQLRDFPLSGQPLWLPSPVAGAPVYAFAF